MNRRDFIKTAAVVTVAGPTMLALEGCPSQDTLAALVTTLGNSAASIASLEGNTTLSAKLQADTAAAATAIANWKSGSPAQMAIQAINIVEDDLNLFPIAGEYEPLIVLALSTAASIIELLNPQETRVTVKNEKGRHLQLAQAPKTVKDYKTQWNNICNSNSKFSSLVIK